MKDNKGFTLVELLGVLTLLAIISVITVPLVGKYINNSREKAYEIEIESITKAAKEWMTKYSYKASFEDGEFYLPVETLIKSEFLEDEVIVDPRNPEEDTINGCVKITENPSNKYDLSYVYEEKCPSAQ